ncbi:hypothetical protein FOXB_07022 [Fusarium oxysporum f. sp. conglutinans Fo5176]|uniref:Uncharacterized protein n=1 Tax=Fusarium oxysporum (strain Fo5176) TaxID=660025 RepID=F9FKU3_FUSOF|nr:hypothetical protein FOXB_07022 [Fusarium oxysporum f. sp. conglutinans Fo5176]
MVLLLSRQTRDPSFFMVLGKILFRARSRPDISQFSLISKRLRKPAKG